MQDQQIPFVQRSHRYGSVNVSGHGLTVLGDIIGDVSFQFGSPSIATNVRTRKRKRDSGYCSVRQKMDDDEVVEERKARLREHWIARVLSFARKALHAPISSLPGPGCFSKQYEQTLQASTNVFEDDPILDPVSDQNNQLSFGRTIQPLAMSSLLALACNALFRMDPKDRSHLLVQCRKDMVPALLGIAWFVSTCALYLHHISQSLSDFLGGCVIFQDMFGSDVRVPLSTCSDRAKLRYHLCAQYVHSPAEAFLASNKFNIKDRWGRVIQSTDWRSLPLKANLRLTLAVVIEAETSKCPHCTDVLNPIPGTDGDYYWYVNDVMRRLS